LVFFAVSTLGVFIASLKDGVFGRGVSSLQAMVRNFSDFS
jgi:hypothetical protein